jgi:hypothetical protein
MSELGGLGTASQVPTRTRKRYLDRTAHGSRRELRHQAKVKRTRLNAPLAA